MGSGFTIVPEACHSCPAAWLCVMEMLNNLLTLVMSLGVLILIILLAYAGILLMFTAANPENKSQAKKMLINGVIGLVIMLSAWLIINTVLEVLGAGGIDEATEVIGTNGTECVVMKLPDDSANPPVTPTPGPGGGGERCTPIPDSELVTITGGRKLVAEAAQRFEAMRAAAANDGITLHVSSAYRSPDDQLRVWNQNGCRLVNNKAVCAVRTAAVPCSLGGTGSNHSRGTAVDITLNAGVYDWLRAHAAEYGFYNNLSNDRPHWSDTGR